MTSAPLKKICTNTTGLMIEWESYLLMPSIPTWEERRRIFDYEEFKMSYLEKAKQLFDEAKAVRRQIYQHPEVGFDLARYHGVD